MKKCPTCAEEVQDKAIKCKHCGKSLKKSRWGWWVLGIFIVLYAIGSNSNNSQSTNAETTVQGNQPTNIQQPSHPALSPSQRFGRFFPAVTRQMVSLNGFRIFTKVKPGCYFIMNTNEDMQQQPKVLIYTGQLSDGYEFGPQDVATYAGKTEYRKWDTESVELYDVYSLE